MAAAPRWLWWIAGVAMLIHVLIVLPSVTVILIERQAATEARRRHDGCVATRDQRLTLLDLIDFATQPEAVDPDLVSSVAVARSIEIENARRSDFRTYAHNHLQPLDC